MKNKDDNEEEDYIVMEYYPSFGGDLNENSNINHNDFTKIICHPPYHADFSVAKMFIEKGFNRLTIGGHLYMVTKRKEWYKNKLISTFGGVKIWEIDGYFIFMAIKKSKNFTKTKPRKKNKVK